MRNMALSVVAVLAIAGCAFAQSPDDQVRKAFDDQVRNSTVAPDLHNASSGWNMVSRDEGALVTASYQGKVLTVQGNKETYNNEKEDMRAYLYSKTDANGNSEEVAMLYGTDNVARGAIKVNGKWYVSKELYFENGLGNPNGRVSSEVVYDKTETDKPVKVKFALETVDGHKELVFDLQ